MLCRLGLSVGLVALSHLPMSCVSVEEVRYGELVIPDQTGKAMTVLGAVAPSELGDTLMHEHLYLLYWIPLDEPERWEILGIEPPESSEELKIWNAPLTHSNRNDLIRDEHYLRNKDAYTLEISDTLPEIVAYKELGGRTIVDMPPIEAARSPLKLVELSKETGVHIVAGTSFYIPAWHPENIDELTISDLAQYMVRDIVAGMDNTGVRAGLISEVPAVDLELGPKSNNETRILRAAGRASRLTGAAMSLHSSFEDRDEIEIMLHRSLDILEEEGVDLSRVAVGHAYVRPSANSETTLLEGLLERGVYVEFDLLGSPGQDSAPTIDAIAKLIASGYAGQLLVSQDICTKFHLSKYGGGGLTYIHTTLIPALRTRGVGDIALAQIIEDNPRQMLTFVQPKPLLANTAH